MTTAVLEQQKSRMFKVEDLKKMFPNPKAIYNRTDMEDYCVGGALCLALGGSWGWMRFPSRGELREALKHTNPLLTHSRASTWAALIFQANDKEQFLTAWDWLDKALKDGGENR